MELTAYYELNGGFREVGNSARAGPCTMVVYNIKLTQDLTITNLTNSSDFLSNLGEAQGILFLKTVKVLVPFFLNQPSRVMFLFIMTLEKSNNDCWFGRFFADKNINL